MSPSIRLPAKNPTEADKKSKADIPPRGTDAIPDNGRGREERRLHAKNSSSRWRRKVRVSGRELEGFTRNLQTQLAAGVPLIRALEVEIDREEPDTISEVVEVLAERIRGGSAFSEALEEFPLVFPKVYAQLIRAGEVSGRLETLLGDLGSYLTWREDVRKTIKKAVRYPIIVVTLAFAVILFILGFVFPSFDSLFVKFGDDIPASTKFLMDAGKFIAAHWGGVILAFLGIAGCLGLVWKTGAGRNVLLRIVARFPVFGGVLRVLDLARWTRTLAVLETAGIPLVQSLEIAGETLAGVEMREAADLIRERLIGGETFAAALQASPEMPSLLSNLAAVGEESGRMESVLQRLADHYDAEAREKVDKAIALFEPMTTIFLGILVGGMAAIIISTLYKAMTMVGR